MEEERYRKAKRNRVKLDLPKLDRYDLPVVQKNPAWELNSSQKGRGREACIQEGSHDWVWAEHLVWIRRSRFGASRVDIGYPVCQRCGQYGKRKTGSL